MRISKLRREFDFDMHTLLPGSRPKGVAPSWAPWAVIIIGAALIYVTWTVGGPIIIKVLKAIAPAIMGGFS